VLDRILPANVVVVATRRDLDAQLFPEEKWIVRQAIESRRREFTTARACARSALAQLGLPAQSIPVGTHGNPEWPTGIVGSISHCDGYRAAAVTRTCDFATIGIDAEPNRQLPNGVLEAIASREELERVRGLMRDAPGVCWDRLLFSIKEAVYKAWFPLTGRSLGFEDASIQVDRARQEFSAQLQVAGFTLGGTGQSSLSGRWLVGDGLVAAAIALSAT